MTIDTPITASSGADEQPALTGAEGEELIAAATRSREADRELAAALRHAPPAGPQATVGLLDELGRRGALPGTVERELVAAAQTGDPTARGRLVEAFMPLIASVARVYRDSPRVERLELLQEGVVGLLRALERYDPERGVPFWGYAAFWVRQAMQQLIAEVTRPLVLSDRALRQLSLLSGLSDREREILRARCGIDGPEQSLREIGGRLGVSAERVRQLEQRALGKLASAARGQREPGAA